MIPRNKSREIKTKIPNSKWKHKKQIPAEIMADQNERPTKRTNERMKWSYTKQTNENKGSWISTIQSQQLHIRLCGRNVSLQSPKCQIKLLIDEIFIEQGQNPQSERTIQADGTFLVGSCLSRNKASLCYFSHSSLTLLRPSKHSIGVIAFDRCSYFGIQLESPVDAFGILKK